MPEGLPDINLLPKYERESSSKSLLLIIFIAIILIGYILIGYYYFATKKKFEAVNHEHTQLNEEITLNSEKLAQLENEGNSSLEQAVTFVENYHIPTSTFITELDFLLPEKSYLSEYEYDNGHTRLVADFETLDMVANYTTALINSDYINDTKVDQVETFIIRDEAIGDQFETIPRYKSEFSLIVNKANLKGASEEDE